MSARLEHLLAGLQANQLDPATFRRRDHVDVAAAMTNVFESLLPL